MKLLLLLTQCFSYITVSYTDSNCICRYGPPYNSAHCSYSESNHCLCIMIKFYQGICDVSHEWNLDSPLFKMFVLRVVTKELSVSASAVWGEQNSVQTTGKKQCWLFLFGSQPSIKFDTAALKMNYCLLICGRWKTLLWMHTDPHWRRLSQVSGCLRTRSDWARSIRRVPAQRKDPERARGDAQTGIRTAAKPSHVEECEL